MNVYVCLFIGQMNKWNYTNSGRESLSVIYVVRHCFILPGNLQKQRRKLTVWYASVHNNLIRCVRQVPRWWGAGVRLVQHQPSLAHRCWSRACSSCQIPHWVLWYCWTEWVLSTSTTHPYTVSPDNSVAAGDSCSLHKYLLFLCCPQLTRLWGQSSCTHRLLSSIYWHAMCWWKIPQKQATSLILTLLTCSGRSVSCFTSFWACFMDMWA